MGGTGPYRVARVITRLGVGGSERYVCSLTAHMDRREFRSWLVCGQVSANERQWSELANEAGIQPIRINQLRRGFGPWDAAAALRMIRLFRSLRPAIVETHTAKAGALGRIAALLAFGRTRERPRLIHTFHGHVFKGHFSGAASKGFIAIERWLAHFTDMIIAVSTRIRDELVKEYRIASPEKIRVVPLGFDFDWVGEIADRQGWLRRRLGVADSTVLFGSVGRLAKIKNTALLLRAFARVLREDPRLDARLVLIGDGELRGALELLASELGIRDRMLFCGWVLNRAEIFSDLDVTCLCSLSEGLPVCLIDREPCGRSSGDRNQCRGCSRRRDARPRWGARRIGQRRGICGGSFACGTAEEAGRT